MLDKLLSQLRNRNSDTLAEEIEKVSEDDTSASIATLTPLPLPPRIGTMGDLAEEAVEDLSEDLKVWFDVDFNALMLAWTRFTDEPQNQDNVGELFRTSHNLAGAETLYNQPEISRLCRSLAKLVGRGKVRSDKALIGLHIDACRSISSGTRAGSEADEVCKALEQEVTKLVAA